MTITFVNKSAKDIYINFAYDSLIINSGERKSVVAVEAGTFGVQVNEGSYVRYILEKFGVVFKRCFKLRTEYSYNMGEDITVTLISETRKGKFMDEYERVICRADNTRVSPLGYSVPDEAKLKKELAYANKRADNTIKLFDVFDILGNALSALLFLLIPFVIIWIFADIELAGKICGIAFIPIFGLIIYLNRFFDKLKRRLWKTAKDKRLENEIFKDYNSYFDSEYIESVLGR